MRPLTEREEKLRHAGIDVSEIEPGKPYIFDATTAVQGSEKWFSMRLGIPTASEFSAFMDKDFNLRRAKEKDGINAQVWTYICEKCAERFGGPLPAFTSFVTDQGKLNEKLARKWMAMECEAEIQEVAFIQSADGKSGCSPDGLLGDDEGCEIKCPQTPQQVRYLLDGEIPADHLHQVHGSLYVTGRKRWHYLSYHDGFPVLHLTVERDEAVMGRIGESLRVFTLLLEAAYSKLIAMP
jgi:YqaJ-like viral recombinase domain